MNTEAGDLFIGLLMGVLGPLGVLLASGVQDGEISGLIRHHCGRADAACRGTRGCHC